MKKCEFSTYKGPNDYQVPNCHVHNCVMFFDETHCVLGALDEMHNRIKRLENKLDPEMRDA